MSKTLRVKKETHRRIVQARGILEHRDGKRRSLEDVVNEALDRILKERAR